MNEHDEKLKLAMARLLPNDITIVLDQDGDTYYWKEGKQRSDHFVGATGTQQPIFESEWLRVMEMVEELVWNDTMVSAEYCMALDYICQPNRDYAVVNIGYTGWITHATFNQRATAMCKIKGITIC